MKKFLLSLCLGTMAVTSASAITPQELDGKPVLQMFWGSETQALGPSLSTAGVFRYEGGQLYIDGFRQRYTLPVNFNQSTQTISLPLQENFKGQDGTMFQSGIMAAVEGNTTPIHTVMLKVGTYNNRGVYNPTQVGSTLNGKQIAVYLIQDNMKTFESGKYGVNNNYPVALPSFEFNHYDNDKCLALVNSRNSSTQLRTAYSTNTGAFATYSKVMMWVMDKWNATATDSNGQEYKMAVQFAEDGSDDLVFPNLYNRGVRYSYDGYNYKYHWIPGRLNRENNTVTVDANYSGGMYVPTFYGWGENIMSGLFSREAGTLGRGNYYTLDIYNNVSIAYNPAPQVFYQKSDMIIWDGYRYLYKDGVLNNQIVASNMTVSGDYADFDDITGTFSVDNVYHETPHHQWAKTAGGELRTFEDLTLNIGKSVFYNQAATSNGTYGVEEQIDWTKIQVDKLDVTHHCEIDNVKYGNGPIKENDETKYIYLNFDINQIKNNHHVDASNYEIFITPGAYTTPEGSDFNHENGHVNGVNITNMTFDEPEVATFAASNEPKTHFSLLFKEDEINKSDDGKYTVYVKANYPEEKGLAPTFHSLLALDDSNINTGIGEVANDNSNVVITGETGAIVVEGAEGAQVEVYTAAGVQVYAGADSEIAVEAGLYIVKVGSKVQKVVVR